MSGSENKSDPFEEAFLNLNPNPNRIGCPSRKILEGLASKRLPISHPSRMHIGQCSPCWKEFRALEAAIKRRRRWILMGSVAALMLASLLVPYLLWLRTQHTVDHVIFLDLRLLEPTRGINQRSFDLHLPRRVFQLAVVLPWGSDHGAYEATVVDSHNAVVASAHGVAEIMQGNTHLKIDRMDFTHLNSGRYLLTFIHKGELTKANFTVP